MERRAFLTGLFSVASAVALAGVAAQAAPIARPLELLDDKELAKIPRTPDGTPIEKAQTVVVSTGPRRRYRRRRSRMVCRSRRVRGRYVRSCHRVYW